MIRATLPLPPSTNMMYRTSKYRHGMYKTEKAYDWIKEASLKLRGLPFKSKEKIKVNMDFYFKRERDIDGGIKALLDLIQTRGIIANDSQVYHISATKNFDKLSPRVEVAITSLNSPSVK